MIIPSKRITAVENSKPIQTELALAANTEHSLQIEPEKKSKNALSRASAFAIFGFQTTIQKLQEEVRDLYTADDVPWIIGYSGGKDSTATTQLVWTAIAELAAEERKKPIHVISTDTLVENPIVAAWVSKSLDMMGAAACAQEMPFRPHLLKPRVEESFWVNLLGRGYPAPRPRFRWCTERLKIQPSNRFISNIVTENGEAILCLGVRKSESSARAKVLRKNTRFRVRDHLSPSDTLAGCLIYSPIESWTNDDVWFYLTNLQNPWNASNKELMSMYAGASPDGECPLVVDSSTPSCGDSRFGCWVCTLVDKDKSMAAMIQNDSDKDWLMPLLDIRNTLDFRKNDDDTEAENSDRHLRDFRRMTGAVQIMANGKEVPGPYLQSTREQWLFKLLRAQTYIRSNAPTEMRGIELITMEQLAEIRRIWVVDKHEIEDSLPKIYKNATGQDYPIRALDDNLVLGAAEMEDLKEICGNNELHYELTRELLSLTWQQRTRGRRAGLFEQLEKTFRRHFYDNREDALNRARQFAQERRNIHEKRGSLPLNIQ